MVSSSLDLVLPYAWLASATIPSNVTQRRFKSCHVYVCARVCAYARACAVVCMGPVLARVCIRVQMYTCMCANLQCMQRDLHVTVHDKRPLHLVEQVYRHWGAIYPILSGERWL